MVTLNGPYICEKDGRDRWKVIHVTGRMGWSIGHTFKNQQLAQQAADKLNELVALDTEASA